MTLRLPDGTKHARIVHVIGSGPVQRIQLRHVPSDWMIHSEGKGADLAASVEELRRRAEKKGYVVDEGFATEDLRRIRY